MDGESPKTISFIDVLKRRDFFFLWIGQLISQFGDRLNQMALIALIINKSPDLATEISKLFFFMVLPGVLLGPIAGVLVDRWDRKQTMIITDLIRALLVISIPFAAHSQHMWPIYLIVLAIFTLTRLFIPAKMAIIPTLVNKDELFVANSVSSIATMIATIAGMALGGLIIAWVGIKITLFIDAGTYLVSALFLLAMAAGKIEGEREKKLRSFLEDLGNGFRYLYGHRMVYGSVLTTFALMAAAGISAVVAIVFLREQLGGEGIETKYFIRTLGILGSLLGVGMFLGTVVAGQYGHKFKSRHIFFTLPLIGIGGAILLMTLSKSPFFIGTMIFIGGLMVTPILIFINASIHRLIPKSIHGRVFSVLDITNNISLLFSILLAGFLAAHIDERTILQILGIALITLGFMVYLITHRQTISKVD